MFAYKNDSSIVTEPVAEPKTVIEDKAVQEIKLVPEAEPIIVAAEVNPKANIAATPTITSLDVVAPIVEDKPVAETVAVEIMPIAATTTNLETEEVFTAVVEDTLPTVEEQESVLPAEPAYITTSSDEQLSRAAWFFKFSKFFYVGFLLFLIIALLINIFVRLTVQHKSVIIQSILLIVLVAALLLFDFGFMKEIKQAATNIILF